MKNKKIILLLIFLLLLPKGIFALTEEERLEKIYSLPYKEKDGVKYFEISSINPYVLSEEIDFESGIMTYEEYEQIDLTPTEEEYQENVKFQIESNKNNFYSTLFRLYLNVNKVEYSNNFTFDFSGLNKLLITYGDDEGANSVSFEVIWSNDTNSNIRNEALNLSKKINEDYSVHGMSIVNTNYHYQESTASVDYKNNIILYKYPELKKFIETNPQWEFTSVQLNIGGTPFHSFGEAYIGLIKDGMVYAIKQIKLSDYNIIYVDKDEEGTIKEKAIRKLYNYFNGKLEVSVPEDGHTQTNEIWQVEEVNNEINKYLNTNNVKYESTYFEFNVGTAKLYFSIIEVDKENLDYIGIETYDEKTDISIKTENYGVPFDVRVFVKDVNNEDYVKDFIDMNKYELKGAYDINLKKMSDNTYIKKIDGEFEVYIPLSDYEETNKLEIIYIKENSEEYEKFSGVIEEIDGKKYIKFNTNHFSTYIVAKEKEEENNIIIPDNNEDVENITKPDINNDNENIIKPGNNNIENNNNLPENPNTLDNVVINVVVAIISLIVLILSNMYIKKFN